MKFETIEKSEMRDIDGANSIHHYPAKMATQLGDYFINEYTSPSSSGHVFDPFCGSGTTLLLSRLHNFDVYGCDILEVPIHISKSKVTTLTSSEINQLREITEDGDYPEVSGLDQWKNREIWFHDDVYQDLMRIRKKIDGYHGQPIYSFLFTALSNVVWEVSSADPDVLVPTRSDRTETQPFYETDEIIREFKINLNNLIEMQRIHKDMGLLPYYPQINQGDAKDLKTWAGEEYDMILTSPPYGDGIDYRRSISLQTRFFNLDDEILGDKVTKHAVGRRYYHEDGLDALDIELKDSLMSVLYQIEEESADRLDSVVTYLNDISIVMKNMKSKLKDDGIIGLVVGNPEVANIRVPFHKMIIEVAQEHGMVIRGNPKKDKISNRFQTPVRRSSDNPIEYEYLLPLQKSN